MMWWYALCAALAPSLPGCRKDWIAAQQLIVTRGRRRDGAWSSLYLGSPMLQSSSQEAMEAHPSAEMVLMLALAVALGLVLALALALLQALPGALALPRELLLRMLLWVPLRMSL